MELPLMLDAARGASAARITAVIPHYSYARSARRTRRVSPSVAAWLPIRRRRRALTVLTMTLHSPQVHGFFSVPVDYLHALQRTGIALRRFDLSNTVVVSPDLGNAKTGGFCALSLGMPVAAGAGADHRHAGGTSAIIGEVAARMSSSSTMKSLWRFDPELLKHLRAMRALGACRLHAWHFW